MLSRDTIKLIVLVAAGVLLAGGLAQRFYERGRWQERVNDLEAQVDSTDNYWAVLYAKDSTTWAQTEDKLRDYDEALALDSAEQAQRADSFEVARAASLEELEELKAQVDPAALTQKARELLAAFQRSLAETKLSLDVCREQLATAGKRHSVCEQRLTVRDDRIALLETLRRRYIAERDSARALLKPPPILALTLDLAAGVGCATALNGTGGVCGLSMQLTVLRFRIPLLGSR